MSQHRDIYAAQSMSDVFISLHVQPPQPRTYAKRAEECRRLAKVSPREFKHTYLKLAAEYEQLATEPEKSWEFRGTARHR